MVATILPYAFGLPGAMNELAELVKPAVARIEHQPGDKLHNAIRANVQMGMEQLMSLDPILGPRVRAGRVRVGGGYDLRTETVARLQCTDGLHMLRSPMEHVAAFPTVRQCSMPTRFERNGRPSLE